MTTVHTLASGSSGNAMLLTCGQTRLLVDAGISCRRITASLRTLELSPEDLDAVLITHAHTDHIAGLQTLLKHITCPVLATEQTCRQLDYRIAGFFGRLLPVELCACTQIGEVRITPFPISHDIAGACGFRFDTEHGSVGLLTDTGYVTEDAARILPGVDLAVLEANYDEESLCSGSYPYYLKQRILGCEGHLRNEDAARFAVTLAESGTSEILLVHLSQENNTPVMAQNAVALALSAAGLSPAISVAPRDHISPPHHVTRRGVCRK
ncbi:MAG: MBL fold metallo-hydrolase [Ruminococcaceae bacterium]|nr:MBL fold metallo-hydrolase [Oscillospiraceae bacterium]